MRMAEKKIDKWRVARYGHALNVYCIEQKSKSDVKKLLKSLFCGRIDTGDGCNTTLGR